MHIDWWTLALQTVNVLVLVWLLARFLFRPISAIIAERQAAAERVLADAATERARAETDAAAIQRRLQGLSTEADHVLGEARVHAERECARLMQQAAEAAAHTRNQANIAIESERATMERTLRQRACDLAVVIARRLLQRAPVKTATAALLETLAAAIAELPEAERRNLAAADGRLDIVTAVKLDVPQQTECQNLMGRLFGEAPALVFRTNPELIAGVELHTARMLVRNSWQADLERIASELRQDEQHVAESRYLV